VALALEPGDSFPVAIRARVEVTLGVIALGGSGSRERKLRKMSGRSCREKEFAFNLESLGSRKGLLVRGCFLVMSREVERTSGLKISRGETDEENAWDAL
jgi:hypothetical protein